MDQNVFEQEIELTVPMIQDIETVIMNTSSSIAKFSEFTQDEIEEMNQALIEACINAVEHSKSEDRKLYIKFIVNKEQITVVFRDNGKGFDMNAVEENPDIKNKLKSSYKRGWGIKLIKTLMDKVEIETSSTGTILKMTKLKQEL
ncbi:MAG: ATP-binding protein [Candidatus Sericytochromatia bacterium]